MRFARLVILAVLASLVGACSTTGDVEVVERSIDDAPDRSESARKPSRTAQASSPTYTVVRGDTLFGIAFRNGVDVRDLVRWNRIADPNTIYAGQVLKLGEGRAMASHEDASARVRARDGGRVSAQDREDASARVRARDGATVSSKEGSRETGTTAHREYPKGSAYPPRGRSDRGTRYEEQRNTVAAKPLREGEVEVHGIEDGVAETRPLESTPVRRVESGVAGSGTAGTANASASPVSSADRASVTGANVATNAPTASGSNAATGATAPNVAPASAATVTTSTAPTLATTKPIAPAASRVANGVAWRWPVRGSILQRYAAGDPARQGIDIRGKEGDAIAAAADGEVVYSGNGLLGYGELVIVKHSETFLSAYAHNRARLVKEGDRVKAGQQIAEMGSTGAGTPALHFEIRQNGKPVDPLQFLPSP